MGVLINAVRTNICVYIYPILLLADRERRALTILIVFCQVQRINQINLGKCNLILSLMIQTIRKLRVGDNIWYLETNSLGSALLTKYSKSITYF